MIFKSPSERDAILSWHQQGHIKDSDLVQALIEAESLPSPKQWHQFITQLLLWLGLISLGASLIFFFAFNWQSMSKFSKFAFVQFCLIATVAVYFFIRNDPVKSTALATLISLIIGALLALVGQTYQTGADPWQLFAVWAVFILPFSIAHGSSTLWLMFTALLSLSTVLYDARFRGMFDLLLDDEHTLFILLAINSLSAVVLYVGFYNKLFWSQNQIASQFLIICAGFLLSWLAVWGVIDFEEHSKYVLLYTLGISVIFYWFRYKDPNLMLLTGVCLSLVVVTTTFLIKFIGDAMDEEGYLLISIYIIACSSYAGVWLKNLHQQFKEGKTDA